jgi:tetratricopeptide (TPR) repeat protein
VTESTSTSEVPPSRAKKKKKTRAEIEREMRELSKPAQERPPVDTKKIALRIGLIVAAVWIVAAFIPTWIPKAIAGVLTLGVAGAAYWVLRMMKKNQALGAIMAGADTEEGRKEALEKLSAGFGKDDAQAIFARGQLELQDDPRKALATFERIDLGKQMAAFASQVRATRAQIHLMLGEVSEARKLADELDLGKQDDAKLRANFATVAAEAWARSGNAKKAMETLDLFNPEDPEFGELRPQMWRARAFAYAASNDTKGIGRALRKLAEINPHLLAMFVGQKKIHPLLEREAKQVVMKMGVVPRKVVRQRM